MNRQKVIPPIYLIVFLGEQMSFESVGHFLDDCLRIITLKQESLDAFCKQKLLVKIWLLVCGRLFDEITEEIPDMLEKLSKELFVHVMLSKL